MAEEKKPEVKAEAPAKAAPAPKKEEPKAEVKKDTVTVFVPKAFKHTMDNHAAIQIKAGMQEMDPEMANHWWMKANGVEIYKGK